jgi:hypothetical protein
MVKIKINNTKYKVPTSFKEVIDFDKLMVCETVLDELKTLTTIPADILSQLNEEQQFAIANLTSFLDDINDLEDFVTGVTDIVDVEIETYEKLELAKMAMKGKMYQQLYKVAKVYYPKETDNKKLLSIGYHLYIQIATFLEHYKDMYEGELDNDEIMAGVHQLIGFGAFGTAFVLAGRDLLKLRSILDQPALDVYTALHYSFRENKYQMSLHEIRYPKLKKA